ncbi:sigma-70 family RNA polymerase sigma factor [Caulobacter sp. CCNWLY153]|uniref:RNA polymerase sigma factor n=1 Tax=unclassified Caulobacter TaxID=2648921 RepID=UPI002FF24615
MSDTWANLRRRLLSRYEEFVRRLTKRFGSADLAREIVHETYMRFERVGGDMPIHNPDGYIFRTAINIAKNKGVVERRYLNFDEIDALAAVPDEAPDPARIAEARSEMALMQRALAELPARRREIFEASWVDGVPHADLALRYGVHLRTIQRELEQATLFVRSFCKENGSGERRISLARLSSQ